MDVPFNTHYFKGPNLLLLRYQRRDQNLRRQNAEKLCVKRKCTSHDYMIIWWLKLQSQYWLKVDIEYFLTLEIHWVCLTSPKFAFCLSFHFRFLDTTPQAMCSHRLWESFWTSKLKRNVLFSLLFASASNPPSSKQHLRCFLSRLHLSAKIMLLAGSWEGRCG